MSKKDGRLDRWRKNEQKKRKIEDEAYQLMASYSTEYKRINIDLERLIGANR
jgi:hypothetical protein